MNGTVSYDGAEHDISTEEHDGMPVTILMAAGPYRKPDEDPIAHT